MGGLPCLLLASAFVVRGVCVVGEWSCEIGVLQGTQKSCGDEHNDSKKVLNGPQVCSDGGLRVIASDAGGTQGARLDRHIQNHCCRYCQASPCPREGHGRGMAMASPRKSSDASLNDGGDPIGRRYTNTLDSH